MKNWKAELTIGRKTLTVVKIQKSNFQGEALSAFVIAMMPLNYIGIAYEIANLQNHTKKINHFIYMDDMLSKNEKRIVVSDTSKKNIKLEYRN